MSSIPSPITRAFVIEAIHAAFKDPACLLKSALNIEIHIGRKQAAELFADPQQMKWPAFYRGQALHMVDVDSYFAVVPRGSFKKK